MTKDFDEFLDFLYSEETMGKWSQMEADVQSEIKSNDGFDTNDGRLAYSQLYSIRWTLHVIRQYHEWLDK